MFEVSSWPPNMVFITCMEEGATGWQTTVVFFFLEVFFIKLSMSIALTYIQYDCDVLGGSWQMSIRIFEVSGLYLKRLYRSSNLSGIISILYPQYNYYTCRYVYNLTICSIYSVRVCRILLFIFISL